MNARGYKIGNIVTVDNPEHWPELKGMPLPIHGILEKTPHLENTTYSITLGDVDGNQIWCSQFIKYIKPIKFNDEWLASFGFKKGKEEHVWYYGHFEMTSDGIYLKWKESLIHNVRYVHELQNLHFSLTGLELRFKTLPL